METETIIEKTIGVIIEKFKEGGIMKVCKPGEQDPNVHPDDPNPPLTEFGYYLTKGTDVYINVSLGNLQEGDVVEGDVISTLVGGVKKWGSFIMAEPPKKVVLDGSSKGIFGQIVIKYPTILKVIGKSNDYVFAHDSVFSEGDIVQYRTGAQGQPVTIVTAIDFQKLVPLEQ